MRHASGSPRLLLAALLALLPATVPAQAHSVDCAKAAGIDKLRCERHEKMAAKCGPLKGEAHHACDREFLLAHPLSCSALPAAEGKRCTAELAAFKTCEAKAGRAFVVCVRETTQESPVGAH